MWLAALIAGSTAVVFPGTQPQLTSAGDRIYLAFAEGSVISVASSTDRGTSFARPVKIPVAGRLSLGMHRGPRIAATDRAVFVAAVVGQKGAGADGDLLLFRSTDHGTTWAAPVVINDVPGAAREGLHAIAANAQGFVLLTWLDLREKGTRIYSAVSRDHGATWSRDALVYASPSGTVCECCHPSVAVAADTSGRAVMFRNSLDGNRDLYVARSTDGVRYEPARKSGTGSWKLDACPMDGGAVVLDGASVVSVWRRDDGVFVTTLGEREVRVGTGRDPVIAIAGPHRDIAWSGPAGILLKRDSGAPQVMAPGRFPALLAFADRTILAWEHQGAVSVTVVQR